VGIPLAKPKSSTAITTKSFQKDMRTKGEVYISYYAFQLVERSCYHPVSLKQSTCRRFYRWVSLQL